MGKCIQDFATGKTFGIEALKAQETDAAVGKMDGMGL